MRNENFIKQLNDYFEYFKEELILTNKSNYTIKSYKNTINGFIQFLSDYEKDISLTTLNKLDFINFLNYKNLHLQKQQEMSIKSKKLYLIHLKTFFKYLNDLGSYSLDIEKIFNLKIKIPSNEPKGLKNEDVEKIVKGLNELNINNFQNARLSLIVKIMIFSGARRGEIENIQIKNIKELNDLYIIKCIGKGNKARTLYIQREKIVKELNYFKENKLEFIAISRNRKKINGVQIYKLVGSFFKKLNVNYKGVHELRHTFAKNMIAKDVNITIVQKLLGHESISTTMIYTNPDQKEIENAYLSAYS